MDVQKALAALAEPTRFRIVEMLDDGPRTVGEIAQRLGARQPATSKHLQALEAAGVVTAHRLGRRRVVALDRAGMREIARWLGTLTESQDDESVLEAYRTRVEAEERRLRQGTADDTRTFRFHRTLPGTPDLVWAAWTNERLLRHWWAPRHFEVSACTVQPEVHGALRIVMREADGSEYVTEGEFTEVNEPHALRFDLAPLGPDGHPLFAATYDVALRPRTGSVSLEMVITACHIRPEAAAALAGVEIGWNQQLDRLTGLLEADRD